jgi:hypothetical protein
MGKPAVLAVDIITDARDATKGFESAGKAADGFADKVETAGDRSGDTATALSALSGALDMAGLGGFSTALQLTATALDASEGATILFRVAKESLNLTTLKTTVSTIAGTVATYANTAASYAAQTASKAWAAAQWLLNAAMTANPIGLIIAAVVLLIGVIVLIATKTTWFQDMWAAAWAGIQDAAAAVWKWIVTAATTAWNLIIAGVRTYIGIWSGIFEGIRTVASGVWDGIKDAAKTALDFILDPIDAVKTAFDKVVDAIRSVIDWLGKIEVPDWMSSVGDWVGGLFSAAPASRSVGTRAGVGGPSTFGLGGAGAPTSGPGAGTVVNVFVPESSDPVATARYLRALLRRGQDAGVMLYGPA